MAETNPLQGALEESQRLLQQAQGRCLQLGSENGVMKARLEELEAAEEKRARKKKP
tara:strand:+ start:26 stop:193 length:168 start_codon:yes stop_codon:yes gene_type:complete